MPVPPEIVPGAHDGVAVEDLDTAGRRHARRDRHVHGTVGAVDHRVGRRRHAGGRSRQREAHLGHARLGDRRHGEATDQVGRGREGDARRAVGDREVADLARLVGLAEVDGHGGVLRGAQRREVQLRERERHVLTRRDIGRQTTLGHLLAGEVGREARVVLEIPDPQVAVHQTGVGVGALGERPEVVASGAEEGERRHPVGLRRVEVLAVDDHRGDPRTLRLAGVLRDPDVVRETQGQERTGRRRATWIRLPLLLENRLELGTGQVDRPDVVDEREYAVGLGVGDHTIGVQRVGRRVAGVLELRPEAARVDDPQVDRPVLGRQAVAKRVGHQVAEGGLRATVLDVVPPVYLPPT